MIKAVILGFLFIFGLTLGGCATMDTEHYSTQQAYSLQAIKKGVIIDVREVVIEDNSLVATGAGAALGGLAGNQIGGGSGKVAGAIVGALIGGALAGKGYSSITKKKAVEVFVEFNNGEIGSVVQEGDINNYPIGKMVYVSFDKNGNARIK